MISPACAIGFGVVSSKDGYSKYSNTGNWAVVMMLAYYRQFEHD